jgi:uncharacterized protein
MAPKGKSLRSEGSRPDDMPGDGGLPAGRFSAWLRLARKSLRDDVEVDVPCGGCIACCASSHFVHVRPEETRALARIPLELLFPAPGLPEGNVVMGYDEHGRCPMLTDAGCSIYEDRPLTCRTYDCRVFAAAGIEADTELITERTRRWLFSYPTAEDRALHKAVRAAAAFIREHRDALSGDRTGSARVGLDPPHVALLAVKVYETFVASGDALGEDARAFPRSSAELIEALVEANARFERGRGKG